MSASELLPVRRSRRGFTLIELLIVVVVIGILAVIATGRYGAVRERANRGVLMTDLRNLATAQEGYYEDRREYAGALDSLAFNRTTGVQITIVEASAEGWSARAVRQGFASSCTLLHGKAAPISAKDAQDHVQCE